jgi:lipoprotein-anchoring transpeptidase ErfK/SrfK
MNRRLFLTSLFAAVTPFNPVQAATKRKTQTYRGAEIVTFDSPEQPGTVIVNTHRRRLYYILGDGRAIQYGVAVGLDGFDWAGIALVGRKLKWPRWTPPRKMLARKPELRKWANGMPGGRANPLGARALYLYANGRDTLFRIHGTNEPWSIGTAASSGCIRMLNEEVSDLFERVEIGTKVIVL